MSNGLEYQINMIEKYSQSRQILVWGCGEFGQRFVEEITTYGIEVYAFIDTYKCGQILLGKYDVYSPDILKNNKDKYYVCCATNYYKSIEYHLNQCGYSSVVDYLLLLSIYTLSNIGGFFIDQYANNIDCKGADVKVTFCGKDSGVKVGRNCDIPANIQIYMKENAQLVIGNNVKFGKNVKLHVETGYVEFGEGCEIGDDAEIKICNAKFIMGREGKIHQRCEIAAYDGGNIAIGNKCRFGENSHLVVGGLVEVGDNTSFEHDLEMRATPKTYIKIGKACLFSYNISMRSSDGHGIFDSENRKCLSHNRNVGIEIEDHVWVGMDVCVLYNTVIGSGSIIGALSLVKTEIPNNCMYAGNPAKLIRTNVDWDISVNE